MALAFAAASRGRSVLLVDATKDRDIAKYLQLPSRVEGVVELPDYGLSLLHGDTVGPLPQGLDFDFIVVDTQSYDNPEEVATTFGGVLVDFRSPDDNMRLVRVGQDVITELPLEAAIQRDGAAAARVDSGSALPPAALAVLHRVTNDPAFDTAA